MRDFFHGWRRKLGCAMLLVACGLMIVWFRSFLSLDLVYVYGSTQIYQLFADRGRICCRRWTDVEFDPDMRRYVQIDIADADFILQYDDPFSEVAPTWRWSFAGFHFGAGSHLYGSNWPVALGVVPLWSLILPLALLSAWLIWPQKRLANLPGTRGNIPNPLDTLSANRLQISTSRSGAESQADLDST